MKEVKMLMILQATISAIFGMFGKDQKKGATKFYQFLDSHNVTYGKTANYKLDSTKKWFFIMLDTAGNNVIALLHDNLAKGAIIGAEKLATKQAKKLEQPAVNLPVPTLYEQAITEVAAVPAVAVLPAVAEVPVIAAVPAVAAVAEVAAVPAIAAVAPTSIGGNVISITEYNRLKDLKRLKPEQKNALTIYQFVNGIK